MSEPPPLDPIPETDIDELWRSLRRHVSTRLHSPDQADDVVQDAWLRLLSRPPRRRDRIHGWLRVVADRLILESSRRRRNEQRREQAVARTEADGETSEDVSAEQHVVLRLLEELREPYREVVRLRYIDELGASEISTRLGRSEATVRSQLKRGLDLLRIRLGVETDGLAREKRPPRRLPALFVWLEPLRRRSQRERGVLVRRALSTCAASLPLLFLLVTWFRWSSSTGLDTDQSVAPAPSPLAFGRVAEAPVRPLEGGSQRERVSRIPVLPGSGEAVAGAPSPIEVRGLVWSGPDAGPIAGARIVLSREPDGASEVVAVSGEDGRFSVPVTEFPAWIGAVPDAHASTSVLFVDRALALSQEELILESLRTGSLKGIVVDEAGNPVAGAEVTFVGSHVMAHPARGVRGLRELPAGAASTRTDEGGGFSLPTREVGSGIVEVAEERIGTGTFQIDDASLPHRLVLGEESLARTSSRRRMEQMGLARSAAKAAASRSGVLRGRLGLVGEWPRHLGIEIVIRCAGMLAPVYVTPDDQLSFEVESVPAGELELYIEGAGAHGSWLARKFPIARGESLDLETIAVPSLGELRVRAVRQDGRPEARVDRLTLTGRRGQVIVHLTSPIPALDFDAEGGVVVLRRIWPGQYRVGLGGEGLVDAVGQAEIQSGRGTGIDLRPVPGAMLKIQVRFERSVAPDEGLEVRLCSPRGIEVQSFGDIGRAMGEGNVQVIETGVADDVDRIELRTTGGLTATLELPEERASEYHVDLVEGAIGDR